jgi:hypothetical protein
MSAKITARPQKACTHQSGFIQSISVFFQVDTITSYYEDGFAILSTRRYTEF